MSEMPNYRSSVGAVSKSQVVGGLCPACGDHRYVTTHGARFTCTRPDCGASGYWALPAHGDTVDRLWIGGVSVEPSVEASYCVRLTDRAGTELDVPKEIAANLAAALASVASGRVSVELVGCPDCEGKGETLWQDPGDYPNGIAGGPMPDRWEKCDACNGAGMRQRIVVKSCEQAVRMDDQPRRKVGGF